GGLLNFARPLTPTSSSAIRLARGSRLWSWPHCEGEHRFVLAIGDPAQGQIRTTLFGALPIGQDRTTSVDAPVHAAAGGSRPATTTETSGASLDGRRSVSQLSAGSN